MANEILNTNNSTTGLQDLGERIVKTPGKGSFSTLTDQTDLHTIVINTISDKYNGRWPETVC